MICLIACMSQNRVIGKNGKIPWEVPGVLKRVKDKTMNQVVLMGRKTYESLKSIGLKNRYNYILTNDKTRQDYYDNNGYGCVFKDGLVQALESAVRVAKKYNVCVYIIGGESIYRQCLPYADSIDLTILGETIEGDAFFPEFNESDYDQIGTIIKKNYNKPAYIKQYKNHNPKLLPLEERYINLVSQDEEVKDILEEFKGAKVIVR